MICSTTNIGKSSAIPFVISNSLTDQRWPLVRGKDDCLHQNKLWAAAAEWLPACRGCLRTIVEPDKKVWLPTTNYAKIPNPRLEQQLSRQHPLGSASAFTVIHDDIMPICLPYVRTCMRAFHM